MLRPHAETLVGAPQAPRASVHWYGKGEVADQRKVGHVTITAPSSAEARRSLALIDPAAEEALARTSLPAEPVSRPQVRGAPRHLRTGLRDFVKGKGIIGAAGM